MLFWLAYQLMDLQRKYEIRNKGGGGGGGNKSSLA